jgi:flagella basal body P-ring formation protein FlgA
MSKGKWICLALTVMLILLGSSGFADDTFNNILRSSIIDYYNLGENDVEIEIRSNRVKYEAVEYDSLSIEPMTRKEPRGLISFKVSLYKNDLVVADGQVRVKIAYFENVLVTQDRISRHETISPDKITLTRMEVTSLTGRPLTSEDELTGMRARRSIKKGQILNSGIIEVIPVVFPGQGVSILYKSGGLEINAQGTAMEDGNTGDLIRVRNNQSGKTILCTVLNSELVQIASN